MKNYVAEGKIVNVTAPYDVTSGGGALVGNLFGVAAMTALSGSAVDIYREGIFDLAKPVSTGITFAQGDRVYWDNTNKVVTSAVNGNRLVGIAMAAAADADATARVMVGHVPPGVLTAVGTLNFASIAAAASADLTVTVAGAATGDAVALGLPAAPTAGIIFQAFVSAANTVTVRATNITAGAVDPASLDYRVAVIKI